MRDIFRSIVYFFAISLLSQTSAYAAVNLDIFVNNICAQGSITPGSSALPTVAANNVQTVSNIPLNLGWTQFTYTGPAGVCIYEFYTDGKYVSAYYVPIQSSSSSLILQCFGGVGDTYSAQIGYDC